MQVRNKIVHCTTFTLLVLPCSVVEEVKKVYKFNWQLENKFQILDAWTEETLKAKQVLDVFLECVIGDGSAKPSQEVALKVTK